MNWTGCSNPNADQDQSSIATCDWIPAVDIKEEKDRYVLRADIPWCGPKDIEIIAENGILTLRGNRPGETRETRAGCSRSNGPAAASIVVSACPTPPIWRGSPPVVRTAYWKSAFPKLTQTVSRTIKVEG